MARRNILHKQQAEKPAKKPANKPATRKAATAKKSASPDYQAMPWQKLQKLASKAGVLERGMGREEIIAALNKKK